MAFVVCVSASGDHAEETLSSLNFAARAVTVEQTKAVKHIAKPAAKPGAEE